MTNYTEKEILVYNTMIDICFDDPDSNVEEISEITTLSVNTVKGVIGSLVKKGLVMVESDNCNTVNPIVKGEILSYGCDHYDEDEIEEFKL